MSINKKILHSDFCVIGGGSGGLSFTAGAVQMGASVILFEDRKMGGDCLNYGCIPSKSLISLGKAALATKEAEIDYIKIQKSIQQVIANIAKNDSVERFTKLGTQVILEHAQFVDKLTLESENYIVKAKRFIIATGSYPFVPPIEGLRIVPYLTNETIFELKELPKHLVIIGGGPIGIELAQAFHNLGTKITVLEAFSALPKDDPELTIKLKQMLMDTGILIKEHVKIINVRQLGNELHISYTDIDNNLMLASASHILVATGRRANVNRLNLNVAGIQYLPQGIVVDSHLKTTNNKVYAIGDCTGGYQFTHVAGYHASLVIRNAIFKLSTKIQTKAIPWVTYTDPELAHVGLIEAQAIEQKIVHRVLRLSFFENDRAQTENRIEGMIKVLVTPRGAILGVSILGPHAGELIYPWVICIQNSLNISTIANSIAPYPTFSDINKRIAGSFYTDKIFSATMHKIVKFMTKFMM